MPILVICLLLLAAAGRAEVPILPVPQHVVETGRPLEYNAHLLLEGKGLEPAALQRLQAHWQNTTGRMAVKYAQASTTTIQLLILGKDAAADQPVNRALPGYARQIGTEGYLLILTATQKIIAAYTETGLFYGLQSLRQLTRSGHDQELLVADWPSFAHRVVFDDISRGPISTISFIKDQIRRLAEIKINYLSFYIEHVVQTAAYPDFAPENGRLTIADIRELSAYAAQYHMQLIGSFQSFGHFEKILAQPKYRPMGATNTMVDPMNPEARRFLASVIGELCEAFSAPFFNVNSDETFDLGKGTSKPYVDSMGAGPFYASHLRFLYDVVKKHNKRMMMWGDIALQHEEILDSLPKDIIYLSWEYGNPASFDKWTQPFKKRGLEFMVCPGILNSYRLFPDVTMAGANIDGFARAGKASGATGVFTTIWDDGGASFFSGDWFPVYKAAEKSWNLQASFNEGFNERYTRIAYGSNETAYVQALQTLMQLRKLPMTFNLNDNVWYQKLLPDSGRRLLLNTADVPAVRSIAEQAAAYLATASARWHAADLQTLRFSIDQYQLIADTRALMPELAQQYKAAQELAVVSPAKAIRTLEQGRIPVQQLQARYRQLKEQFRTIWLQENQAYWLNVPLAVFDEKIADLQELLNRWQQAQSAIRTRRPMPDALSARMAISATWYTYFQNWLLCGPFSPENGQAPPFLYDPGTKDQKPPKPGDIIVYKEQSYRWMKYASPNGGITQLEDFYPKAAAGDIAYAYCSLTADSAQQVNAFVGSSNGLELFCNGQPLLTADGQSASADNEAGPNKKNNPGKEASPDKETGVILSLQPGINHILFRFPKASADWAFTFRLDPALSVTNSKHKFYLNPKTGNHDAE